MGERREDGPGAPARVLRAVGGDHAAPLDELGDLDRTVRALAERVRNRVAARWSHLLAAELVAGEVMAQFGDDDILPEELTASLADNRDRLLRLFEAALATYLIVGRGTAEVVVPPQPAEAESGQLTTTVDLGGSAVAARLAELSFGLSGTVSSIEVSAGDEVTAGQTLATLDAAVLEQDVTEAQLSLTVQQANLSELTRGVADPATAARVASAQQSVLSAQSRLQDANDVLGALVSPTNADVAAAESRLLAAEADVVAAEEELARFVEGPTAAQLATADLAVANAQSRLFSSADALTTAEAADGIARTYAEIVTGDAGATADQIIQLLLAKPKDPLVAGAARNAAAQVAEAIDHLEAAIRDRVPEARVIYIEPDVDRLRPDTA